MVERAAAPTAAGRRGVLIAVLGALCAALALPSFASAAWLSERHDRCPVDDPDMLSGTTVACVASDSSHGTFRIGDRTVETGNSNLQFGTSRIDDVLETIGGTVVAEPSNSPGGLLGMRLPDEGNPLFQTVNDSVLEGDVLGVRAQVERAGEISDFDPSAGLSVGSGPIIKLPVKIQLVNPVLGDSCYIGSEQDPIVLQPQLTKNGTVDFGAGGLDPDDPELQSLVLTGAEQGDDTFAVPEASGCGPLGTLDPVVNQQLGLPSPAGNNEIRILDQTTFIIRHETGTGAQLAEAWHEQND